MDRAALSEHLLIETQDDDVRPVLHALALQSQQLLIVAVAAVLFPRNRRRRTDMISGD